ncbi:MAG: zinc finger domain-containing protein [Candidatus Acidiferrales bacterium]
MKKKELTPEQMSSVPCPTCGVAAGQSCVLHSGGPRSEPHTERKLSAIEAMQKDSR